LHSLMPVLRMRYIQGQGTTVASIFQRDNIANVINILEQRCFRSTSLAGRGREPRDFDRRYQINNGLGIFWRSTATRSSNSGDGIRRGNAHVVWDDQQNTSTMLNPSTAMTHRPGRIYRSRISQSRQVDSPSNCGLSRFGTTGSR
jgi:hypothetical protein